MGNAQQSSSTKGQHDSMDNGESPALLSLIDRQSLTDRPGQRS